MNKNDINGNIEKNSTLDINTESAVEITDDAQIVTNSAQEVTKSNNEELKRTGGDNECDLITNGAEDVNNNEKIITDKNEGKKSKKKNKKIWLIIIPILLAIIGVASFKAIKFFNTEVPVNIEILDTNSPISEDIDKFIKENKDVEGIHSIEYKNDTYTLISSGKTKAKEASINLYQAYSKGFDIYLEYNLKINEKSIDESNPERVQMMLLKFNNARDVKGVLKTDDSIDVFTEPTGEIVEQIELKPE